MPYRPNLISTGLNPIHSVVALDEYGRSCAVQVASEVPLTLLLDKYEVVTLMTLGTYPEALALGYLKNQGLIQALQEISAIHVNWETETVIVDTLTNPRLPKRHKHTVTTGCGQGAVLSINKLYDINLPQVTVKQSSIYALLQILNQYNHIHRQAGGVHGCALCQGTNILTFVEDVGRHNAVDTIAGLMWLQDWLGDDKIFYTTGRLTSEIVMKVAHIGIPVLISRSGITYMGIETAQESGITLITHAKGQHFLVFNGEKNIIFDACPSK